ncbi:hypothetical protein EL22_04730 [Halostagnicola sp. A56]|uniref:hypothetical protein n=1 Tax=Halostagnicola sp. A56 TaxID=1495067 RepID=UPI00065F6A8B|nr:hypothetical protein [Halostagnicola sp. A56]KDE58445.2 hypothetical protein EL22_04730 [Halostagnicola sp. A56]
MTNVLGVSDPQTFIVLVIALIGVIPVIIYRNQTSQWFVLCYCCLFIGAIATNFENVVFGTLLNFVEHIFGNMGAGIAFAVAAYLYRQHSIDTETQEIDVTEG